MFYYVLIVLFEGDIVIVCGSILNEKLPNDNYLP